MVDNEYICIDYLWFMKKFIAIILSLAALYSCNIDREKFDDVTIKLINETKYTLTFSSINNGGDSRFYPVNSITLKPDETYSQTQTHIGSYEPIVIAPAEMTIECEGKILRINYDTDIERNPCRADNWRHYSNYSKYGPGVFFDFSVTNQDLDNWFGTEQ